MTPRKLEIEYIEYSSLCELEAQDRELVNCAVHAMRLSYSPYSGFRVGAAVRMSSGAIVEGANQENAAYPSGLCAERTALYSSVAAHPGATVESIALCGGADGKLTDDPISPCGACRQVLAEFQKRASKPISVIMAGTSRIWKFTSVADILPFMFDEF